MMSIFFYILFMIPLFFFIDFFFIFSFMLVFVFVGFMSLYPTFFFSSLSYGLGVDLISYGLNILTLFIVSLMIFSSLKFKVTNWFVFLNLILCFILMVIFSCLNIFVMYIYFEFSLIPLLILILGWGYQPERLMAGLYLFFYTLFASLPLLLLIIYIYLDSDSLFFDFEFCGCDFFLIHVFMVLAFLVKFPMFMLHFWLPKAHVQAPVSGSMILAGLFLKIGGYGLIRFMNIYECLFNSYSYIWFSFSILGSSVVGLICLVQGDIKSMIAYSSVSHMGMCVCGIMSMSYLGVFGSYLMMISHGLCSSALFCGANMVYERLGSRSFFVNKGLMSFFPNLCFFWFLLCSFNMGCPPSINFLSELVIMISMLNFFVYSYVYLIFIFFFSSCFSIYLYSYTYHGSFHSMYSFSSVNIREYLLLFSHLFPILVLIFCLDNMY